MDTILLATDGSEYARIAARRAIEIAADNDATVHALCVVDRNKFSEPALSAAELETIYAEDHAAMCVSDVADMAAEYDVPVEGDTRHGIPHEVILAVAEEVDADVIVVGEHGDHSKHFSGVGEKTSANAECDVLVVEAMATEETDSQSEQ
jgi:nucleotide-binding universal stress UspA family protein